MKPMARETAAVILTAAFIVHLLCARPWAVLCANFYLIPTATVLFPSIRRMRMQRLGEVRNPSHVATEGSTGTRPRSVWLLCPGFYHQVLPPPPLGLGISRGGRKVFLAQGIVLLCGLSGSTVRAWGPVGPVCVTVRS